MKKIVFITLLALIVAANASFAAPKKANRGQCISDCVQAFNKSVKDKGADADKLVNFTQKECSSWCKDDYTAGDGYFWDDGVCNENYVATDPDCVTKITRTLGWKPYLSICAGDFECQSNNCEYFFGSMYCLFPNQ